MEAVFDATIAVVADEAMREERAGARGHAAVAERAGRQLSQEEKAQRADFTVRNDGIARRVEADAVPRTCETRTGPVSSHARPHRPRARSRRARPAPAAGAGLPLAAVLGAVRAPRSWSRACSTRRCARSRCRCATRTSSASRRADKNLDPALIAAVIYEESKFRDQTSHAGARGLMQITPEHRRLHRAALGRRPLRAGGPRHAADQHLLRHLVPALPARPLRRATRRWRSPPTTPGRATWTTGSSAAGGPDKFDAPATSRSPRRAPTSRTSWSGAGSTASTTRTSSGCPSAVASSQAAVGLLDGALRLRVALGGAARAWSGCSTSRGRPARPPGGQRGLGPLDLALELAPRAGSRSSTGRCGRPSAAASRASLRARLPAFAGFAALRALLAHPHVLGPAALRSCAAARPRTRRCVVPTASSSARSCETSNSAPSNASSASSSASRRRGPGGWSARRGSARWRSEATRMASDSRRRSPPDSPSSGFSASSPENRNCPSRARALPGVRPVARCAASSTVPGRAELLRVLGEVAELDVVAAS